MEKNFSHLLKLFFVFVVFISAVWWFADLFGFTSEAYTNSSFEFKDGVPLLARIAVSVLFAVFAFAFIGMIVLVKVAVVMYVLRKNPDESFKSLLKENFFAPFYYLPVKLTPKLELVFIWCALVVMAFIIVMSMIGHYLV